MSQMTADELIDDLAKDPKLQTMPRDKIAAHVRLGRAHGYPDCCIRAFVFVAADMENVALTADKERYMRVTKRRLCPQCLANAMEFAADPDCHREQELELAMGDVRGAMNNLYNTRKNKPADAQAEDAAWKHIRNAVGEWLKRRGS